MQKLIYLVLFVSGAFGTKAQSDSEYQRPSLIVAVTGGYENDCDLTANVQLELKDSTLIPFNEGSTFEMRLDLKKHNIKLEPGSYRILYSSKISGLIEFQILNIEPNNTETVLEVNFEFLSCCLLDRGKYLIFERRQIDIIKLNCENLDFVFENISESENSFKIIGIYTDSTELNLAFERATKVKQELVAMGVSERRLKIETQFKKTRLTSTSFEIYPPDDEFCNLEKCEIGVLIEKISD